MNIAVDLWLWPLTSASGAEEEHWQLLSEDERARADRFVFAKHRRRFIHGRGRLRQILASYLDVAPQMLAFEASAYGKPSLAGAPGLHFNLSHSEDLGALGVSTDVELGVDIEWIRPLKEDIANRYFAPRECDALQALPAALQPRAFFECWTRKEAYIKASGEGLSLPLDSFEVAFGPDIGARFLRIDAPVNQAPADWRLHSFEPAPGCIGAIAAKTMGRAFSVRVAQD